MKERLNMKKTLILLFAALLLVCAGCKKDKPAAGSNALPGIGLEDLDVHIGDVVMTDDEEGYAEITVKMPDYTKLFLEAAKEKDPEAAVERAAKSGNFDVIEHNIQAQVVTENGVQVIKSDEAVEFLMEQELIKAINAVTEQEDPQ